MGQYDWTVSCSATVDNNYSATQAKVTVYSIWNNVGWRYQIAYRARVYADGQYSGYWYGGLDSTGVGTNGSVNVGGSSFIVNKGENARNITCYAWIKDDSGNAYAGGGEKRGSTSVQIGALKKYTITFDANGGTGAPASIQKSHGIAKDLPTSIPTRSGYEFLGWATTSTGSASYSAGGSFNLNADTTLYAVWKALASQGTNVIATIGTTLNLTWTKFVSAYRHTIKYSFGSVSGTLTTSADTSYSWAIPMSLCNQVTDAEFKDGTWTVETYNGTTLIGTNTYKLTLQVPASVVPSFSHVLANVNTYFTAYSTKHSKLRATFTTQGAYGSTVRTAMLRYDDIDYTVEVRNNSAVITSNELAIAGSRPVALTIIDSRGRSLAKTLNITVYEYNQPRIDSIDLDIYGNQATINVKGVIAPINNQNSKYITIKKVRLSDEQESTVLAKTSLADYNYDKTVIQTIADLGTETYEFFAIVEDKVTSATASHVSGMINISRYAGGKGVAFFGEAQADGIEEYIDNSKRVHWSMTSAQWQEIYDLLGITED